VGGCGAAAGHSAMRAGSRVQNTPNQLSRDGIAPPQRTATRRPRTANHTLEVDGRDLRRLHLLNKQQWRQRAATAREGSHASKSQSRRGMRLTERHTRTKEGKKMPRHLRQAREQPGLQRQQRQRKQCAS
jgi:hypothetical protein